MDKNQETANRLSQMNLSDKAIKVISGTDIAIMFELFGHCTTPEHVEEFVNEYFPEDEDDI